MIGYTTIGTNDLERASAFYDALFADLGAQRIEPNDRVRLWRVKTSPAMFGIAVPFDGKKASAGNGAMMAVNVESKTLVQSLHAKALELGATDEGAPGPRGGGPFFGGYFRDLDGNKIAVFVIDA